MRHRGPDSRNLWLWSPDRTAALDVSGPEEPADGGFYVGLGHARLSIIDLTGAANQPMIDPGGAGALVFNGEIYDYIEQRRELQAAGECFETASDTEVLLRALLREGPAALHRMNGMWGLGLFEPGPGRLTLSRDRYGKKPLFYWHDAEQFIAASEMKAIFAILGGPREMEPSFAYGFLMGKRWPVFDDQRGLYRGVRQVPPGGTLTLDLARHEATVRRDNVLEDFLDLPLDLPGDPEQMEADIRSAVELRLRSDVPVGVLVSGGVDSSFIAACAVDSTLADNVSFYTIATNDAEDVRHSRRLAESLGIRLIEVESDLSHERMAACYLDVLRQFEMPVNFGLVVLPGYLIYERMAADGVRVALDGTGGDEVLGGYAPYFKLAMESCMRAGRVGDAFRLKRLVDTDPRQRTHSPLSGWLRFLRRAAFPGRRAPEPSIEDSRCDFLGRYARLAAPADLAAVVGECYGRDRLADVADFQRHDIAKGQMAAYLFINDQISMRHSVENRSPLLDYRLYKYLRLPLSDKLRDGYNKWLLRRSLPASVPDEIRWRRTKAGFSLTPSAFLEDQRRGMEARVRDSALLRGLFDLDALLAGLAAVQGRSHFRNLLEHLYSVALLEDVVEVRA